MNEIELKQAFRGVLLTDEPPPSMSPGAALAAAHRAHRQRRGV